MAESSALFPHIQFFFFPWFWNAIRINLHPKRTAVVYNGTPYFAGLPPTVVSRAIFKPQEYSQGSTQYTYRNQRQLKKMIVIIMTKNISYACKKRIEKQQPNILKCDSKKLKNRVTREFYNHTCLGNS